MFLSPPQIIVIEHFHVLIVFKGKGKFDGMGLKLTEFAKHVGQRGQQLSSSR